MTASPRMVKRCWIKAGLLAEANEEGEVELRIDHQVDEASFEGNNRKL